MVDSRRSFFSDPRCRLLSRGLLDRDVSAEPAECGCLLAVFTMNLAAVAPQKDLDFMQVGALLLERRGGRMFLRGRRLRRGFAELGKQEGLRGGLLIFHRG